jgi:hypothetical protein
MGGESSHHHRQQLEEVEEGACGEILYFTEQEEAVLNGNDDDNNDNDSLSTGFSSDGYEYNTNGKEYISAKLVDKQDDEGYDSEETKGSAKVSSSRVPGETKPQQPRNGSVVFRASGEEKHGDVVVDHLDVNVSTAQPITSSSVTIGAPTRTPADPTGKKFYDV